MKPAIHRTSLVALGLGAGLCMGGAQASVIGGSPNASFASAPYTLSLANDAASYTFQNIGTGSFGGVAVQTGDNAQLANNEFAGDSANGQPIGFVVDSPSGPPTIRGGVGSYASFDSATSIFANDRSGEQSEAYLGLKLNLADGAHYGYARFTDANVVTDFGYQSEPDTEIVAGTPADSGTAAPVPEPGSIAMLGFGALLLTMGVSARRNRRPQ